MDERPSRGLRVTLRMRKVAPGPEGAEEVLMKITKEQLAVRDAAKKEGDYHRVALVPSSEEPAVTAFATDGAFAVAVTRIYDAQREEDPFPAVFEAHHARAVADTGKSLKIDAIDVSRADAKEAPRVTADFYDPAAGKSLADHSFPATHEPWSPPEIMHEVLSKPKAIVALDSRRLATLAKIRAQVGGHGPLMIEVRDRLSPVVVRWKDSNGHRAKALLMPMKVEEDEWAEGLW